MSSRAWLQRLGIMRAVIQSFVEAIAREVILWTSSLKSLPCRNYVQSGRRKTEGEKKRAIDLLRANRESSIGQAKCYRRIWAALLVVVQPRLSWLDRSIDRRGRSRGGRAKREDSWVEKRIWNLWAARYRHSYDRFERGMLDRMFF